jgi:hypothetical protein
MKMPRVGAESFHADGQTDIKEPKIVLRTFANAPKNNTVLQKTDLFLSPD